MTPEQLKASILQYAIQGKLVEQRPEEGTGEDIFNQLKPYHKGIKPCKDELDFSSMDFGIPESWTMVELNQIFDFVDYRGKTPTKITSGVFLITASNIKQGYMDYTRKEYISFEEYNGRQSRGLTQKGDLLFTTEAPMGNAALCDLDECSCGQRIITFKEYIKEATLPALFMYFILSPQFQRQLLDNCTGTTAKGIKAEKLKHFLLPLPPYEEQKRIVAKIEELLPYVDRYAAAYEKLEQFNAKFPEDMKKSILQYAIQGKLVEQRPEEGTGEEMYRQIQIEKQRLIKTGKLKKTRALPTITDEEVPYDFPTSWKVCYIDDIAFVTKLAGFEYTKYIADNLVPTGIPLFKGKNVQNGKLVLSFESYIPENVSDELPRSQITKKCLLTPYVGTIGNIAVFDGSFKAHLGSNVGKIELLNSDTQTFILEEYVLWYLKSTYGYAELTKYKKATAQESISIDAIRNVVIAIPPLDEQKRIVAKLEEILPLCERLK